MGGAVHSECWTWSKGSGWDSAWIDALFKKSKASSGDLKVTLFVSFTVWVKVKRKKGNQTSRKWAGARAT